jgi:hypothetical protein
MGESFVICSDLVSGAATVTRPPRRSIDVFEVWTGSGWSAVENNAMRFTSMDGADDYIRLNLARLMG